MTKKKTPKKAPGQVEVEAYQKEAAKLLKKHGIQRSFEMYFPHRSKLNSFQKFALFILRLSNMRIVEKLGVLKK